MNLSQPLNNSRGQSAIFVALMFNVLFVFFAMAINIALVVHDKINLQNSADLAAYYAASKQAEMLNAIAHQNYAIRQSWKVLSWRYRALGTMGLRKEGGREHPVWTGETSDTPYVPAQSAAVCVTYKPTWAEVPDNESLCNKENLRIPALPEVKVIAGFLGLNAGLAALSRQLRAQFDGQCHRHGAYNWWFAMSIMHAFRIDQRNRRQVISGLAGNLSDGQGGDFLDLDGNSVRAGALATFKKNLTYGNRQRFSDDDFLMMNSLQGIPVKQWLPTIEITPTMLYVDTLAGTEDCAADVQPINRLPQRPEAMEILRAGFPRGLDASSLIPWAEERFLQDSDYQFSIGVEKNPWYLPYVGVRAKTSPRQIFFPIGNGIEMFARAFAKPIGGRIGPWYGSQWQRGSPVSSGTPVDSLMAPRMAAGGLMNSSDPRTRLPNYSRFPGDTMGMTSKMALNGLQGLGGLGIEFDFYKNIKEDMAPGAPNDVLAWNGRENKSPAVRNYELAIASPDLFDIAYYSIDPNFTANYLAKINANKAKFKIPYEVPVRGDLGHNGSTIPDFSVQQQMETNDIKNLQKAGAYFFVRDKAHLLTAWLPGEGFANYEVSSALKSFGKCSLSDDQMKFKNPGACVAGGGRTGYSVKILGRDALFSPDHNIGGLGSSANAILNPPNSSDGW